jgi:hypothetical protein
LKAVCRRSEVPERLGGASFEVVAKPATGDVPEVVASLLEAARA